MVGWMEKILGEKEGEIWFLQQKVMGLEFFKKIFIHKPRSLLYPS